MSESTEPEGDEDSPVRGARPGESGYRRDDYWRKVDRGTDVDAGTSADEHDDTPDAGPEPATDADSPKDVGPQD